MSQYAESIPEFMAVSFTFCLCHGWKWVDGGRLRQLLHQHPHKVKGAAGSVWEESLCSVLPEKSAAVDLFSWQSSLSLHKKGQISTPTT